MNKIPLYSLNQQFYLYFDMEDRRFYRALNHSIDDIKKNRQFAQVVYAFGSCCLFLSQLCCSLERTRQVVLNSGHIMLSMVPCIMQENLNERYVRIIRPETIFW